MKKIEIFLFKRKKKKKAIKTHITSGVVTVAAEINHPPGLFSSGLWWKGSAFGFLIQ